MPGGFCAAIDACIGVSSVVALGKQQTAQEGGRGLIPMSKGSFSKKAVRSETRLTKTITHARSKHYRTARDVCRVGGKTLTRARPVAEKNRRAETLLQNYYKAPARLLLG